MCLNSPCHRIINELETDRDSGVALACELIEQIRESEAFDGVHLIPVNRFREIVTDRMKVSSLDL
jgi:hypothetical protein